MSKAKRKNVNYSGKGLSFWAANFNILPILAILLIVPFVIRLYVYNTGLTKFTWHMTESLTYDVFLRNRGVVFLVFTGILLILFLYNLPKMKEEVKNDAKQSLTWLVPISVYTGFVLISTAVSPNVKFSLDGCMETFETLWVVLGYAVVAVLTFFMVRTKDQARITFITLAITTGALTLFGLSQLLGKDPLNSSLWKSIILPAEYAELGDSMSIWANDTTDHRVYMTLFNQNYVGVFSAMVLPVMALAAFSAKNIKNRIIFGAMSVLLFVVTLGSGSRAFIMTFGVLVIVSAVIFRKTLFKAWKILVPAVAVLAVLGSLYFVKIGMNPVAYIKNGFDLQENDYYIKNIETDLNGVHVTTAGGELTITFDSYGDTFAGDTFIMLSDAEGNYVPTVLNESGLMVPDSEAFSGMALGPVQLSGLGLTDYSAMIAIKITENETFYFAKRADNFEYVFLNTFLREDTLHKYEKAPFFADHFNFFNNRGYIWAYTIPLLKKHLFLGSGAETFIIEFPNDEYLDRYNIGYSGTVVNKPHNLYFQIWVLYGGIALLAFLAAAVMYFIDCIKCYKGADLKSGLNGLGIGIAIGVLGYLICGLSNDSCLAVAPIFWVMWGLGMAVNKIVKNEGKAA